MDFDAILRSCMKRAIVSLDPDLRREYEEVVELAPHLVRNESKVSEFLLVENNNLEAAAKRLCHYWKARKQLFGERWLLPLNQTGFGALSKEDIDQLRSGYFLIIQQKSTGGVLVLVDISRLTRRAGSCHNRIAFYMTLVHADLFRNGMNTLYIVSSRKLPPPDMTRERWDIFRTALPIKVDHRMVVAQCYEPHKQDLVNYLAYEVYRTAQYRSGNCVVLSAGNSVTQSRMLLEKEHGLSRDEIPRELGGDYDYSFFHEWIRTRLTLEEAMSAAPLQANMLPRSGESASDDDDDISSLALLGPDRKKRARVLGTNSTADALGSASSDTVRAGGITVTNTDEEEVQSKPCVRTNTSVYLPSPPAANARFDVYMQLPPQHTGVARVTAHSLDDAVPSFNTNGADGGAAAGSGNRNHHAAPPPRRVQPGSNGPPAAATGDDRTATEARPDRKPDTYQKRNQEIKALQSQRNDLHGINERLRQENRRLESLLAQSRWLVAIEEQREVINVDLASNADGEMNQVLGDQNSWQR